MTSKRLIVAQHGRVLTVEFRNPPRNFFDEQMSIELDEFTRSLRGKDDVGAVVFTGHAASYVTHFDVPTLVRGTRSVSFRIPYRPGRIVAAAAGLATRIRAMDRIMRHTPARDVVFMARVYASLDRLNRSDKAVVTAVNGLALGMGCVFALACDVRLISEDQQIGLPESALGMLAGAGGAHRLTRMIGTGRAAELLLDGRWLTAQQAVELGLVHRAVPRHELQGEAHRVAERLAARSPVVRREIKRAVYGDGRRWPMREAAGLIATLTSPEARRQLASYESYLAEHHENLTDEVIIDGWHRLLDNRPALARIG